MRLLASALLCLCLCAPAAAAQEMAAPRPLSVVEEPVLRLGDVFENAGERAGHAIGAAPAPDSSSQHPPYLRLPLVYHSQTQPGPTPVVRSLT